MGFTSTSRNRSTPISYMDEGGHNVLWKVVPQLEDDTGFHRGASIALLSQFAEEREGVRRDALEPTLLADLASLVVVLSHPLRPSTPLLVRLVASSLPALHHVHADGRCHAHHESQL